MNTETKGLIEIYIDWLRERSSERELEGGWKELSLPLMDRHNDFLQVYARQESNGIRITDDGATIRDLKQVGCDLKSRTRRRMLAEKILKGFGLSPEILDSGVIVSTAVNGDFPWKLHGVLQSMLA